MEREGDEVVFLRRQDVRGVGVVEVDVGSEFDLRGRERGAKRRERVSKGR